MTFDCLTPMIEKQWTIDKVWMFNRALFLLTLHSRQADLFWHNDEPPEWTFWDEFKLIESKFPAVTTHASAIMTDHFFDDEIGFIEVKNGRT